ncbi:hypothetical protein WN944_010628 [Citrus x changshan-huyou]|uniref:Uncharacterized protein n=1 Tax=Citrus x changshan-huyou TaxID=2935761 RepID=A0AAP0MS11_9ROSI
MAATSRRQLKNICVLSGFRYGKYIEFVQATIDLGRAIVERKLHLVYGGDPPTGEELVVSSMQERISEMLNHADAFIFLSEALATLEALITFASWAHLNIHKKLIVKKLFICAPTANELLDLLQAYKPELNPMTLALDWATDDDGSIPRKSVN